MNECQVCPRWFKSGGGAHCLSLKVPFYRLPGERFPSGRKDVGRSIGDYFKGRTR